MEQAMSWPILLSRGERIVAAVPEKCSGPGWTNRVVWVYIERPEGGFRRECLQPEEQSAEMAVLFDIGAATCAALAGAVKTEV